MLNTIVPLLVPVATGIVGAVSLMLKESRLARSRRNLREQTLAEASAEVAFASEWWKAHQLLGSDATTASTEKTLELLAEAEAKVTSTQHASAVAKNPVTLRRLFLLYPMRRRSAKVLRVLFWLSIFLLMMFSIAVAVASSSQDMHEGLPGNIALWVVVAVGMTIFHEAAEAFDESAPAPAMRAARHRDAARMASRPSA